MARPVLSSWQHPGVRRGQGPVRWLGRPFGQHQTRGRSGFSGVDALSYESGPLNVSGVSCQRCSSERGVARRRGITVVVAGQADSSGARSGVRAGSGARAGSGHPPSLSGAGSSWYAACAAASSKGGRLRDPSSALGLTRLTARTRCLRRRTRRCRAARGLPHLRRHGAVRPVTSRMAFSTSAARGPRENALTMASTGKSSTTADPSTAPSCALPPTIDQVTRLIEDSRSTTSFHRPRSMSASRPPGAWEAEVSRCARSWA